MHNIVVIFLLLPTLHFLPMPIALRVLRFQLPACLVASILLFKIPISVIQVLVTGAGVTQLGWIGGPPQHAAAVLTESPLDRFSHFLGFCLDGVQDLYKCRALIL